MTWAYDKIMRSPESETRDDVTYYFLDTRKKDYYPVPARHAYNAVSFSKKHGKWFPVVFDDYTCNDYVAPLEEITYKEVPPNIKRMYTNWAKYQ